MDVAASEFMTEDGKYDLNFKNKPNDGSEVKTGCGPPSQLVMSGHDGHLSELLRLVWEWQVQTALVLLHVKSVSSASAPQR